MSDETLAGLIVQRNELASEVVALKRRIEVYLSKERCGHLNANLVRCHIDQSETKMVCSVCVELGKARYPV